MAWPGPSWFHDLTGLHDDSAASVRAHVRDAGDGVLVAQPNGRRMQAGRLHMPSLADLRAATPAFPGSQPLPLRHVRGDVIALHCDPANAGALFQVASQANLLEMPSPDVPPEAGVAGYVHDRTQGPACAMACGAGLIWRACFVPLAGGQGQQHDRQVDTLADLATAVGNAGGRYWRMRNGYPLGAGEGIAALSGRIAALDEPARDALRATVRVGVQADTEVTLSAFGHRVTQVLACAMPVAYDRAPAPSWAPLARLVLEAAYEATLRAALIHAGPARPVRLFLTRLGGGAFGNDPQWIDAAIARALRMLGGAPLDVALVSRA